MKELFSLCLPGSSEQSKDNDSEGVDDKSVDSFGIYRNDDDDDDDGGSVAGNDKGETETDKSGEKDGDKTVNSEKWCGCKSCDVLQKYGKVFPFNL